MLELGVLALVQGFIQPLGFSSREVTFLGVVRVEKHHPIGRVGLGPWYLLFLGKVEHDLEQDGQLIRLGEGITLGTQIEVGLGEHEGRDFVQVLGAETRQDVMVQKTDGRLEIPSVQVDVGDVGVTDKLGQGGRLTQSLAVFLWIATEFNLRAQVLGLLAGLVMADGIGVTDLVLAQLAVGISIAKVKRLATGRP